YLTSYNHDVQRYLHSYPTRRSPDLISCMKRRRPLELSGISSRGVLNSRATNSRNSGSLSSSARLRQWLGAAEVSAAADAGMSAASHGVFNSPDETVLGSCRDLGFIDDMWSSPSGDGCCSAREAGPRRRSDRQGGSNSCW